MAAPTLTLAASGTNATPGTSHVVDLPAGTADKVIWIVSFSEVTAAAVASAPGWTLAKTYSISQADNLYVLTRAQTSETSVTVTTSESAHTAWVGGSTDGDIANAVFTDGVAGSGSTNDPDAVTVESGDYRVGAMVAYENGSRAINSYPTDYTDNQVNPRIAGSSRPGLGLATRGLTGITSEDPGAFGMHGGSGANIAATVAIPEASGGLNAPGSPSATANSIDQVTVDWTDTNTAETGYRVERSPAGEGSWVDVSGNLAADTVQYVDTGLDPGTSYDYRIFAFDAGGDGPASSTVTARTDSEQIGSLPLAAVIGQWDSRDLPGADNDPVASWADVGPKGQDPLAQATAAKQPVIDDFDGIRWVLFDGSDDFLTNVLDQSYGGDFAIIVVTEPLTYPTDFSAVLYSTGFVASLEKTILGIDDVEAAWPNGAWVVMSGPEGTQAEHHHGTNFSLDSEIPGRRFVQSQLVRNAGEHKLWENNGLVIDEADSAQGDNLNNLAGMRIGAREDESRHTHMRVGFVLLVDMSQATESELLSARDALMSDFGVGQIIPVGAAAETETAEAVSTAGQTIPIGAATETGSAVGIAAAKTAAIIATAEASAGETVSARKTASTDPATSVEVGETAAAAKPIVEAVTPASESEAAIVSDAAKRVALDPAANVETAEPAAAQIRATVAPASGFESAEPVSAAGGIVVSVDPATEAETARAVAIIQPQTVPVDPALEAEAGEAVIATKPIVVTVGLAIESEAAVLATVIRQAAIVAATEAETAEAVARIQPIVILVSPAVESETAVAVLAQLGAVGFWDVDPVGHTAAPVVYVKAPVGFTRIGRSDTPPW